jgi:hypothetical protein
VPREESNLSITAKAPAAAGQGESTVPDARRAPTDVRQETNINRVPDGGTENSPQERASSGAAACRGSNSASLLRSRDGEDARSPAPPRDILPRSDSTFQCDLAIAVGNDEDPTARSPLGASDSSGDDGQSLAVGVGVAPGGRTTTLTPKDLLPDEHHGDARTDVLLDRHHGADQLTTQLTSLTINTSTLADEHTACMLGLPALARLGSFGWRFHPLGHRFRLRRLLHLHIHGGAQRGMVRPRSACNTRCGVVWCYCARL